MVVTAGASAPVFLCVVRQVFMAAVTQRLILRVLTAAQPKPGLYFTGLKSPPLRGPSQNGWSADLAQAHHQ